MAVANLKEWTRNKEIRLRVQFGNITTAHRKDRTRHLQRKVESAIITGRFLRLKGPRMAFILKKAILASKIVDQGTKKPLGEKIEIAAGMAIEKSEDNPDATTIVISFNGEKYVTDKALLEKAIQ